jgi:hypothetical protein
MSEPTAAQMPTGLFVEPVLGDQLNPQTFPPADLITAEVASRGLTSTPPAARPW